MADLGELNLREEIGYQVYEWLTHKDDKLMVDRILSTVAKTLLKNENITIIRVGNIGSNGLRVDTEYISVNEIERMLE